MRRASGLLLAALAVPAAAGRLEVQGHRGARSARPENTLAGFQYALEAGVDTLELDLHVAKDDALVITHDPRVNPELCLAPGGGRIESPPLVRELTLQQLKRYDCGTLVNPRYPAQVPQPGQAMPTLDELLVWLAKSKHPRARTVLLNVETKIEAAHPEYAPSPEAFVKLVLKSLRRHRALGRSTLQSFDFRTLVAARRLEPRLKLAALVEKRPAEPVAQLMSRLKADILSPKYDWIAKEDVDAVHALGARVIPWTANSEPDWRRLVDIGVDGIISDDPAALLAFLKRS